MPSRKAILLSVGLAMVLYVLLVIRWPGVREGYRWFFAETTEIVYGKFGASGVVSCKPAVGQGEADLDVMLGKRIKGRIGEAPVAIDTGRTGYVPNAVLITLVLASPISWKRKWRALLLGWILVNIFVIFRTGTMLLYWFISPGPIRLYEFSPLGQRIVAASYEFFFFGPACTCIVPALIWALVTFRTTDFERPTANGRNPRTK